MGNTVTYGLTNLYYAPHGSDGYSVPVRLPGAVKITITPEEVSFPFTGLDCVPHEGSAIQIGAKGSVEVATLPAAFLRDMYGFTGTDTELTEKENVLSGKCAVMFETDGTPSRHCYFHCRLGKPEKTFETKGSSTSVAVYSIPIVMRADSDGDICYENRNPKSERYQKMFEGVQYAKNNSAG